MCVCVYVFVGVLTRRLSQEVTVIEAKGERLTDWEEKIGEEADRQSERGRDSSSGRHIDSPHHKYHMNP